MRLTSCRIRFVGTLTFVLLAVLFLAIENSTAQYPVTPRWTFETGAQIISSPALGPDGSIYIGSGSTPPQGDGFTGAFYSVSTAGTTNWILRIRRHYGLSRDWPG